MKQGRKKIYPASRAYEEGLDKRLKTPEYAIAYLNAILDENDPDLLLLGLRDVARAYGFTQIAESTGLNRESLYKALSKGRNPRIGTVMDVLSAIGCRVRAGASQESQTQSGLTDSSVRLRKINQQQYAREKSNFLCSSFELQAILSVRSFNDNLPKVE